LHFISIGWPSDRIGFANVTLGISDTHGHLGMMGHSSIWGMSETSQGYSTTVYKKREAENRGSTTKSTQTLLYESWKALVLYLD
jgi:hypothetical protein